MRKKYDIRHLRDGLVGGFLALLVITIVAVVSCQKQKIDFLQNIYSLIAI